MFSLFSNTGFSKNLIVSLALKFLLMLVIAVKFAWLMQGIWTSNINLYHTILESACIFIALATFAAIWYTYDKSDNANNILGFGFLMVAVFDALHTYYYLKLDLTAISYFDLSTRFWILGRLIEALTVLMAASACKILASKYKNFLISLCLAIFLAYFMVGHHDALPLFLTAEGVTPLKVFMEYFIIFLYLVSLVLMKDHLHQDGKVTYHYIFVFLLLSISAEFCFTLYNKVSNFSWTLGHVLKIISYFYLFRGTFISTVIYPYAELESKNKSLEAVNEELNQMSSTMKDILDALPIAVQKYDKDGRLKYINKKFEELLQCGREELGNASVYEMTEKFVVASISVEDIQSHLEKAETFTVVEKFKTSAGNDLNLSVKTKKIRNGTLILLSDTKKEQELQNLSIQTETILNAISNGVLMIDENKKIVLANRMIEEIYEADHKQLLGMHIDELNEITNFNVADLPDRALNSEISGQLTNVTLTSLKGNKRELNLYVSPISNVYGEVIGAISVVTDITEYKKEQQRLIQQEKLALLGQMGAGIVHETRNFLTTIKGRCQLIDMTTEDERIKKHSAKINSDVEEVNRIISEFLFLSKPRETELEEVSIHDLFQSIKGMVETSSLVRGVNLEVRLCDEDRYMLCDESQLKQVILNICKNGIDAMHDMPNAKLILETDYREAANEICIRISDNGRGIEKEYLDKIGTPFFTTKTTGTGLGLSVCFKIIKEHGGRIEVQSQMGMGTAFTVILPCIEDGELDDVI